jgi:hypothetical protein
MVPRDGRPGFFPLVTHTENEGSVSNRRNPVVGGKGFKNIHFRVLELKNAL